MPSPGTRRIGSPPQWASAYERRLGRLRLRVAATLVLQLSWRVCKARRRRFVLESVRCSAVFTIQARWRVRWRRMTRSAVSCQVWWRAWLAQRTRRRLVTRRANEKTAATTIQSGWLGSPKLKRVVAAAAANAELVRAAATAAAAARGRDDDSSDMWDDPGSLDLGGVADAQSGEASSVVSLGSDSTSWYDGTSRPGSPVALAFEDEQPPVEPHAALSSATTPSATSHLEATAQHLLDML